MKVENGIIFKGMSEVDFSKTVAIRRPFEVWLSNKTINKKTVDRQIILNFIKDLSILMNASVPLVRGLEVLARQQKDREFGVIVGNLACLVHSGLSFSGALMKYMHVFDKLLISVIRAGEMSSQFGEVLERIAKQRDKELKLQKKVRSIMIYPTIVAILSILIVGLLFLFILPKFEVIFSLTFKDTVLPFMTRVIMGLSHSFQQWLIFFILGLVVGIFLIKVIGNHFKDRWVLRIPMIGGVIKTVDIAIFSRICGILLSNGVSLVEVLVLSEGVIKNSVIKASIQKMHGDIENGELLSKVFEKTRYFPEMAISMFRVGEETGTLATMFMEIANKLEEDVELALNNLTAYLEPLMTLLLAVIIGSIVIALFLPIMSIMDKMAVF